MRLQNVCLIHIKLDVVCNKEDCQNIQSVHFSDHASNQIVTFLTKLVMLQKICLSCFLLV